MSGSRLVLWDVAEEHLDEAEFLWDQRERCLDAPNYALAEVADGPEERLFAHVDGLLASGPEVFAKLLVPALDADAPERIAVAVFTWLASGETAGLDAALRCLLAGSDAQRGAARRALELTPRAGVDDALVSAAAAEAPKAQAAAILALASRGVDAGAALSGIRADDDPALVIAALRAARIGRGRSHHHNLVVEARSSPLPAVRDEALAAGLVLGVPETLTAARRFLADGDPKSLGRALLALLATSGEPRDLGAVIDALAIPDLQGDALFALGFSGRAAAADSCAALLGDPDAGRLAGEAFWAITGIPLDAATLSREPPAEPVEPIPLAQEDLDADLVPGPDAALPTLNPAAVGAWWEQHRSRFDRRHRYLFGAPFAVPSVLAALERGPMRRRHALALELAIRSRGRHHLETRALTARQRSDLTKLAALTPADLSRAYDD